MAYRTEVGHDSSRRKSYFSKDEERVSKTGTEDFYRISLRVRECGSSFPQGLGISANYSTMWF